MRTISDVIERHSLATEFAINNTGPFNKAVAVLVLRNVAIVADRLTPGQFSTLGEPAAGALVTAAQAARRIAPPAALELQALPTESETAHTYRTGIREPLYSLQLAVSSGDFGKDERSTAEVKRAVLLGSTAFERVLLDPAMQGPGRIHDSLDYFYLNAAAATRRAEGA